MHTIEDIYANYAKYFSLFLLENRKNRVMMNAIELKLPIISLSYCVVFLVNIFNYLKAMIPLVIKRKMIKMIGIIFGKNILTIDMIRAMAMRANAAIFIYVVNLYITTENN